MPRRETYRETSHESGFPHLRACASPGSPVWDPRARPPGPGDTQACGTGPFTVQGAEQLLLLFHSRGGGRPVPYSHAQSQCHTGAACTLPSRTSASPSPHTSPPPALSPPPTQPPTLFPPSLPSQGGLLPPQTRCPDTADAFFSCPHQDPRGCLWLLVTFLQGDEAPSHTATEKQQGDPSQVRPGLATQRCQPDGRCLVPT